MRANLRLDPASIISWELCSLTFSGFVSFLPRGCRGWFAPDEELYRTALVTGVLQYAVCASTLLARLVVYIQTNVGEIGASAVAHDQQITLNRAQYDLGFVVSTGYFFKPATVFLFYLMCEGMARFFAAAVTRQVVGTAPFYVGVWLCRGIARLYSAAVLVPSASSKAKPAPRVSQNPRYSPLELRSPTPPPK